MITQPGIYEVTAEEYFSDALTPEPALSHSGIVTLLNETPAHFKARNARLTDWPDEAEKPPSKSQALGSVVHQLVLGKGHEFKVIDLSDFRNKDGSPAQSFNNADAKRAKAEAEAAGFIVIGAEDHIKAQAIAEITIERLTQRFGGWPIGEHEMALFWQRRTAHGLIWCRALVDVFSKRTCTLLDLTTTAKAIGDEDLARHLAGIGKDVQSAWYLEGAVEAFPEHAGLWQFTHVPVETEPPYEPRFVNLTESWLTRARFRINRAADLFAQCLRTNEFPGWPAEVTLSAPSYLETRWENEELAAS